jgi:hypothetical protein
MLQSLVENAVNKLALTNPVTSQLFGFFPFNTLSTKINGVNIKVECRKLNRNIVSISIGILFSLQLSIFRLTSGEDSELSGN